MLPKGVALQRHRTQSGRANGSLISSTLECRPEHPPYSFAELARVADIGDKLVVGRDDFAVGGPGSRAASFTRAWIDRARAALFMRAYCTAVREQFESFRHKSHLPVAS